MLGQADLNLKITLSEMQQAAGGGEKAQDPASKGLERFSFAQGSVHATFREGRSVEIYARSPFPGALCGIRIGDSPMALWKPSGSDIRNPRSGEGGPIG
ncbi:MAG: hypothetical protein IT210_24900 [Armatimonadetes bacterium]|nr:hypothetical protein [Armatimonadota bacterium]